MQINNTEETKEFLKKITDFFISIDEIISELNRQLTIKNDEQEDLLHELELSKLNAIEMINISKSLKNTRVERRNIKNNLDILKTLKHLADTYYKKGINAEILQTVENLESLENMWKERKYTPRVLKDLKCAKIHMEGSNE